MTFEEVYSRQYAPLASFCMRKLGNAEDAEDIAQNAFIQLFRTWDRFERRDECRGLLFQMAKWLIYRHRRVTGRMREVELDDGLPSREQFPDPLPGRILDWVWRLPRLQRRAVIMHYCADMTFEEIARAMGTGTSTAEYRTKAGLKKLRQSMIIQENSCVWQS